MRKHDSPGPAERWRQRADMYRDLAANVAGEDTRKSMLSMAETYDEMARREQRSGQPTSEYYRLRADECRRLTSVARSKSARALFEVLERRWLVLAREAKPKASSSANGVPAEAPIAPVRDLVAKGR